MDQVRERSKKLLSPTIAFESRTAKAFETKSLAELQNLYADIALLQDPPEQMETDGVDACGCDVALINLSVIVGFAINKIDGEGRYETWMLEDSLRLLDEYNGFVSDCANDAGATNGSRLLTAQHLKAL